MSSVEEIEKRRAARKLAASQARDEQYAKDLEALNNLEIEHGDERVKPVDLPSFAPGLPTMAIVRCPSPVEYQRYRDMVRRAQGSHTQLGKALDMLGDVCVVYPDEETYSKIKAEAPGLHDSLSVAAMKLAEAKKTEEGKG